MLIRGQEYKYGILKNKRKRNGARLLELVSLEDFNPLDVIDRIPAGARIEREAGWSYLMNRRYYLVRLRWMEEETDIGGEGIRFSCSTMKVSDFLKALARGDCPQANDNGKDEGEDISEIEEVEEDEDSSEGLKMSPANKRLIN